MANELKRYGYRVGFYPLLTVGCLSSLKDPTPLMHRSGVYRVSCGDRLETRINDHKSKKDSAVYRHCSIIQHHLDHTIFELLHSSVKGRTMNSLEEIETVKTLAGNPLNDMTHTFVNPFIRYYYDILSPCINSPS